MKVLGLIPARAGSKGIPDKNLRELAGKPLLAYAAEAAKASGALDRVVLSTDSEAIAELGRGLGIEVPFMRPAELAADDSPMLAVAQHAVAELDKQGWQAEAVVILQATSPLRKAERIAEAVELLKAGKADSVVSVVEIPDLFSPQKAMKVEAGYLRFWAEDGRTVTRRQQVTSAYAREGTVYACRREVLMEKGTLYGVRCLPLVVSAEDALSIDTLEDWQRAESMLREQVK
jgi:CMP-N-acetylneuraminic acid synthetase